MRADMVVESRVQMGELWVHVVFGATKGRCVRALPQIGNTQDYHPVHTELGQGHHLRMTLT